MNTAQDLVDYLLASVGGGAQDAESRSVRQAVVHGTREVMLSRQWLWHTRTNVFVTQQVQTTASITQGSNQVTVASTEAMVPGRLVLFSSPSFPAAVRIISRIGNVITVDRQAAVTASGVIARPQTFYDLPGDLRDIDALVTDTVGTLHCYVTPQEWQRLEVNTDGAGEPYYYTIMRSDTTPDRYQIRFVGIPTDGTPVHYTYRYLPKPIKYMGYERISRQGTVSADGTTITGADTMFPLDAAGAVIRFGTTVTEPDPVGSLAPYVAQREIVSVASGTSLTVNEAVTAPALTKYAITDVVDASPQMYTAILSACDMWYARIAGRPAEQPMAMYNRDLRIAMEADVVRPLSGVPQGIAYPTPRSAGWRSLPGNDVG
jgi:hypothetical protein